MRRFNRHILTAIVNHKSNADIRDLVSEHEAVKNDSEALTLWKLKVSKLAVRWNIVHSEQMNIPNVFGQYIPSKSDGIANGKQPCPFGCGTLVGKTYFTRHRNRCTSLREKKQALVVDQKYIVKDHIKEVFKTIKILYSI